MPDSATDHRSAIVELQAGKAVEIAATCGIKVLDRLPDAAGPSLSGGPRRRVRRLEGRGG